MTEQEAVGYIKDKYKYCGNECNGLYVEECKEAKDMAISALEEIQQYRATGLTPSMIEDLKKSEKRAHKVAIKNAMELEKLENRKFPILRNLKFTREEQQYIPWEVIEPHEKQAVANHGQTLKRLAERGGLTWYEIYNVLTDQNTPYHKDRDYKKLCEPLIQKYWTLKNMGAEDAKLILQVRYSPMDHADDINKAVEVAIKALEKQILKERYKAETAQMRLSDFMQEDKT